MSTAADTAYPVDLASSCTAKLPNLPLKRPLDAPAVKTDYQNRNVLYRPLCARQQLSRSNWVGHGGKDLQAHGAWAQSRSAIVRRSDDLIGRDRPDETTRIAGEDTAIGDVSRDDCAGADEGILPDRYARQQNASAANTGGA
jgi:hypothetical protein